MSSNTRKSQKTSGNSSSIFKLSVFAAAAAILSQSAAAQNPTNDEEADNTIELKDTYVRPDYVEIERMRDTKEIIVIPKEEIQGHGNRTISDVLKSVPGISVNASGPGDIDIRGQGQDQAHAIFRFCSTAPRLRRSSTILIPPITTSFLSSSSSGLKLFRGAAV